ncbi:MULTISPECIES: 3-oxoadipate enol-lactonase [Acinetobacter]|jgi:3-oxoadipate enol-lactonase|uniref:3-oxoadipate enol-lactonase n=1 Tax=Acinetobacter towneri TaxID=202956 RepID=A0AAP4M2S9_9GAMM|nr:MULTISPECIES: 3-oxoadipate enol-lactonase [Acinetobacter]GIT83603.1 3-oxoadipate enol-lactonase [Acinetobacter seohaensis]AVH48616.1 3-oxoadipate enol-lactonase [Acinetobacter sp. SWBY1]MBT0887439.1 3-oxoadipate enol-lactonase [Acinetobacter towneri]MCA4779337.1 3-oxoadipate enol-lactonase [Acinetobacter towneri]MCA4784664.1 3-oxoadipate enol-lactonase [Acinetobacter towneri]
MPTFTSNDAQINYQTFGDATKPALIFSNSLGTNFKMWQAQIDFFQQDFFVICYDTRGHGASSAPQGPYSIDQLGQDVVNLLDHLNVEKAAFCGISMGGLTGQWLAIHRPERFNQVVVCNTAAKIGQEQAWNDRAALVREQGLQPIASTAASRWFTEPFIQSNATVVNNLQNDLAAGSAEGYASCCEALAKADVREQLKDITVPVLVVAGQQDPVTTVVDGQFMVERIANSQLFEINASHISNVELPNEFNQAVKQFIQA